MANSTAHYAPDPTVVDVPILCGAKWCRTTVLQDVGCIVNSTPHPQPPVAPPSLRQGGPRRPLSSAASTGTMSASLSANYYSAAYSTTTYYLPLLQCTHSCWSMGESVERVVRV